jgi:hypothetical protein
MHFRKIQQLVWHLPITEEDRRFDEGDPLKLSGVQDYINMNRYVRAYRDVAFGWRFVKTLVEYNMDFPPILDPQDMPLWRAYWHLKDPEHFYDEGVALAIMLDSYSSFVNYRSFLKGLFLIKPEDGNRVEHIRSASGMFNLTVQALNTYEKLFFNVRDRQHDHKFIRQMVYPLTRLVEFKSDYQDTASVEQILLRAAYNNGLNTLLHLVGDPAALNSLNSSQQFAEELESVLMAQGLFMAQTSGWIHQGHSPAIQNARQLLQAAKVGGQTQEGDGMLLALGASIRQDMGAIQELATIDFQDAQVVSEV